jgi:hypothetical protein
MQLYGFLVMRICSLVFVMAELYCVASLLVENMDKSQLPRTCRMDMLTDFSLLGLLVHMSIMYLESIHCSKTWGCSLHHSAIIPNTLIYVI